MKFATILLPGLLLFQHLSLWAHPNQDTVRNICEYLGGRSDKNFLGSGNVALVVEPAKSKILFVQQWKEKGVVDWTAGNIRKWYPDRIEMNETIPPLGSTISHAPISRSIFITRNDIAGMTLVWKNTSSQNISISATFSGTLPGKIQSGNGIISSAAVYSDKVAQPLYYALAPSIRPARIILQKNNYTISFVILLKPGEHKSLSLLLGTGLVQQQLNESILHWKKSAEIMQSVRSDWNDWFHREIPQFTSSDPYFEKLYYYRWWSLYTKMIFAELGHFFYPSPREGTVAYDGVVSYSGACISVDELRWMRNPCWAFSTTKEFFAPQNLNDGYLSNHIWEWGIDADESNVDALGRSVPYHNYAVDAFRGALLVHPEKKNVTLKSVWPQMISNLQSYRRLFDIDKDGLYETYPWSNSAGQEWTARYFYFDPIPEIFRNERGRTYAPDGSQSQNDLKLVEKIRSTVVTDPDLHWPTTAEEMYRIYYANIDHRLATVDQTTYAYKNFVAAADLAKLINDTASERLYAKMAEQARIQLLSKMWNANDKFFYDVKPVTLKQAKVKATTGFYVFWAKIAGQQHLPMFNHLFDPAIFWTKYPVPSLPLDYEKYDALQKEGWTYWNYATWPRTTCHIVDGTMWTAKMLDSTLTKNASTLFDRYTRMHFPNDDLHRPNIAERYDPHTGAGFLDYLDYNHSSWIDLVMQHIAGITPDTSNKLTIHPIDMNWKSFSFKNIRYRHHDIDIEYEREKGMTIWVDGKIKTRSKKLQKIIIDL